MMIKNGWNCIAKNTIKMQTNPTGGTKETLEELTSSVTQPQQQQFRCENHNESAERAQRWMNTSAPLKVQLKLITHVIWGIRVCASHWRTWFQYINTEVLN